MPISVRWVGLRQIFVAPFIICIRHQLIPKWPWTQQAIKALVVHVEALFLFAFVWSVGCTVDEAGRRQFDAWLKCETASNTSPWLFPSEGTVSYYTSRFALSLMALGWLWNGLSFSCAEPKIRVFVPLPFACASPPRFLVPRLAFGDH